MVLAAGVAPALATFSTSCLCIGLREQMEWSLQPVMHRQGLFTKEIRGLLHEGKWSQSRVLPSAKLAYETGLSAGSIAKWSPHPEVRRTDSFTERMHRCQCFEGNEIGRREKSGLPKPLLNR